MNYMKTTVPDIDTATMDKIMKDVFTMDIKKQLIEYQVEYNVLQEEINTTQHYMESLHHEKEKYTRLESKLKVNIIFERLNRTSWVFFPQNKTKIKCSFVL